MKKHVLLSVVAFVTMMAQAADWSFAGGTLYFNNAQTQWNHPHMMLVIGHNNWSTVYEMSAAEEANMWYVSLPDTWAGASYMAVINTPISICEGAWGPNELTYAAHFSAPYSEGIQSQTDKNYLLTPQTNNDGCALVLSEKQEAQIELNWFVKGDFNDWAGDRLEKRSDGAENTIYSSRNLQGGKEYEFKIQHNDNWFGASGTMTQISHENWVFYGHEESNCKLMTSVTGLYTFAVDTTSMQVSVLYPANSEQATLYDSPVKDNNPDVMLQAFYWAHEGNTANEYTAFGDVKWNALNANAAEIAENFDLVWLAPSQETADYTGYLPMNYSKQGEFDDFSGHHGHSPWGSGADLRALIDNLHQGGAKVIADIVLNHTSPGHVDEYPGDDKNWCSWTLNDFGRYGQFQIDRTWITAEDEMFADDYTPGRIDKWATGDCGNYNTALLTPDEKNYSYLLGTSTWAYSEYNSTYSRDLAHSKKEVREMSRAYLTWMRDSIGYDGFRYDFMKGIHGSHLIDYNGITAPCFSVAEVFDGDVDKQLGFLYDAGYQTYVFDFPGKFTYYNAAIREYKLQNLKSDYSLIRRDPKHTVTFIDNHDSFHEDGKSLYGTANTIDDRQAHQALAFLLSMPGVPCIVYPYWNNYKSVCKAFISARRAAGVHSESEIVNEWAGNGSNGNNYYTAMIKGTKGYLFVKLGYDCNPTDAPMVASPNGQAWQCAWANRDHAGVWYSVNDGSTVDINNVSNNQLPATNKFLRDGLLYIQRGNNLYTPQGQEIK